MRSPRRKFRPAWDARYHGIPGGLSTPVPAPLRRTNNEDDDAQLTCRVHLHDDRRSFFGDVYVSSDAWRALCGSLASHVRCVPLENGWDSYAMAPLIGQYSVSVTLLTNRLFVWVYLNSRPNVTKRVTSFEREREELSIDVKHDSVGWNERKLRTIKNVVIYGVLHHTNFHNLERFTVHFNPGILLSKLNFHKFQEFKNNTKINHSRNFPGLPVQL